MGAPPRGRGHERRGQCRIQCGETARSMPARTGPWRTMRSTASGFREPNPFTGGEEGLVVAGIPAQLFLGFSLGPMGGDDSQKLRERWAKILLDKKSHSVSGFLHAGSKSTLSDRKSVV